MTNISKKYDDLWSHWAGHVGDGPSQRSKNRILHKLLRKYLNDRRLVVLDYGCGDGRNLRLLDHARPGNLLHGADVSERAVAIARRALPDARLQACDLTVPGMYDPESFDCIFSADVLEHICDIDGALDNIAEWLKSSGLFIFTIPAEQKYWSQHDDFALHVRRYSRSEINTLLRTRGLECVECFYWGSLFYKTYYNYYLTKTPPEKIYKKEGIFMSIMKRLASWLLYLLFRIDDFHKPKESIRLFGVYRKKNRSFNDFLGMNQ